MWGYGDVNALNLDLYEVFQSHVGDNSSWDKLDEVQKDYANYCSLCQESFRVLQSAASAKIEGLTVAEVRVISESLLVGTAYRKEMGADLFPPRIIPPGRGTSPDAGWTLGLRDWSLQRPTERDAEELEASYRALYSDALKMPEFDTLAAARQLLASKIETFRGLLSPDAKLRSLVLRGKCSFCP